MNEAASILLRKNDGLSLTRDNVIIGESRVTKELRNIFGQERGEAMNSYYVVHVPRRSAGRPLQLLLSPVRPCRLRATSEDVLCSRLLIFDPDMETTADPSLIMRLYGLTLAESKVVALLMQGRRLEEIARVLHKQKDTVRKQLGSVFAKTDTDRQCDLIRLVLKGPAGHL